VIIPLTEAQRRALEILAGCEQGATLDSLKTCGVSQRTIDSLIARGRISTRIAVMAKPKGLEVTWLQLAK
jgi:hypothetical protein